MKHTECRVCSVPIEGVDRLDGLCSTSNPQTGISGCYYRFRLWRIAVHQGLNTDSWIPYESPQAQVAIDEWLEKGCP